LMFAKSVVTDHVRSFLHAGMLGLLMPFAQIANHDRL